MRMFATLTIAPNFDFHFKSIIKWSFFIIIFYWRLDKGTEVENLCGLLGDDGVAWGGISKLLSLFMFSFGSWV